MLSGNTICTVTGHFVTSESRHQKTTQDTTNTMHFLFLKHVQSGSEFVGGENSCWWDDR